MRSVQKLLCEVEENRISCAMIEKTGEERAWKKLELGGLK